jgi:hypothetical protein
VSYDVAADDARRDRRALVVVLVVLVLLVGGLYAGGYALTSDRLPQGSRVGGVRVGALSPAAARRKIARETAARAARPLVVQVADRTFRLSPADLGLEVDVPGSVAQVPVGRSFDPREMWEAFVGSTDVPLRSVAVGDALERRLDRIADQVDDPVVEGDVRFEGGRAVAVYPQVGHLLDRGAAALAVEAAFPSDGDPVRLSLVDTPPQVSSTEVSRTMRAFANPAMSGVVTYRFGRGLGVVVRPEDFGPALSTTAVAGRLRPRLDGDRLWRRFRVVDSVYRGGAYDGSLSFRVEDRVLRKGQVASYLRDRVVRGFLAVVRRPQGRRVVEIPVTRVTR